MYCYLPVFLCLFESFRRDLNEAKAVYISEYYLVCCFVITTLRLCLKFRLTSLTINSRQGGRRPVLFWYTEQNRFEFHISTDKVIDIQVKLDLFA